MVFATHLCVPRIQTRTVCIYMRRYTLDAFPAHYIEILKHGKITPPRMSFETVEFILKCLQLRHKMSNFSSNRGLKKCLHVNHYRIFFRTVDVHPWLHKVVYVSTF